MYVPHPISSEASLQSLTLLQTEDPGTHAPSAHLNWSGEQTLLFLRWPRSMIKVSCDIILRENSRADNAINSLAQMDIHNINDAMLNNANFLCIFPSEIYTILIYIPMKEKTKFNCIT